MLFTSEHQLAPMLVCSQKRQIASNKNCYVLIKTNMTNVHIISNLVMFNVIKMLVSDVW
jgi:hypothetical protein